MNRTPSTLRAAAAAVLLATGRAAAAAQNFQGLSALQNIQAEAQNAGKYVVNIAFVFCGIVGALCLIPAAIKAFKGEPQSRDAITSIGLGLIAVFVILAIIKVAFNFT